MVSGGSPVRRAPRAPRPRRVPSMQGNVDQAQLSDLGVALPVLVMLPVPTSEHARRRYRTSTISNAAPSMRTVYQVTNEIVGKSTDILRASSRQSSVTVDLDDLGAVHDLPVRACPSRSCPAVSAPRR